MKIFAKRKRTVEKEQSKVKENDINKTFESDEIVKELLKQDPSTWNAKQRRLIKRFHERNPNGDSVADEEANPPLSIESESNLNPAALSTIEEIEEGNEEDATEESDASEDDDSDDDDDESDNKDDAVNEEDAKITTEDKKAQPSDKTVPNDDTKKEIETQNTLPTEGDDAVEKPTNESNSSMDEALKSILDQLNSKQRRTLMRQYDRDPNIDQLKKEAIRLLQENETAAAAAVLKLNKDNTAAAAEVMEEEPPTKKPRRRGPVVDESKLSPEERIRREEQRRLQALARTTTTTTATSTVSDDTSTSTQLKHRHPLNSERRRANRRKPKWEVTSKKKFAPNEHDSSGYHMRKVTKGPLPE